MVVRLGIGLAVKADLYRHVPPTGQGGGADARPAAVPDHAEARISPDLAAELRTALAAEVRRLDEITGARMFP